MVVAVEERLTSLGRACGRAGFRAGFWWRRWWADQVFLVQLGSSSLRPSGLGALAVTPRAIGFLARLETSPDLRTHVGSFAEESALCAVPEAAEAHYVVISHALSALYRDSVIGTCAKLHALLGRITATHVCSLLLDTPQGRAHLVNQPEPFGSPGPQAVTWTCLRST